MTPESSGGARIDPIAIKPEMRIRTLDDREVEKIHEATLIVLQKTGVRFPSRKVLEIFAKAGADVDFEKQIVRIPPELVTDTIARAPAKFTMGSRGNPDLDVILDGTKTYCGTAGTGTATVDLETRQRRASLKKDIAMMALITDYLPSASFYWPMVSAQDTPAETSALHELEAAFSHTEKHVHIVSLSEGKTAQYAVEMATVVAGSLKQLKARPPLTLIASPISPLNHYEGSLEAALKFAEVGLPVGFASMPVLGSTGPASLAGTLVVGNAEILSAVCLVQLAFPGAPVAYPLFSAMLNPFTGGCMVSAKIQCLFYAATVQLGHYYNLPVMSGFGGCDLEAPGSWQAGKEQAIDAFYICATGPDMLPCLGLMDGYTLLYPEKLLLDDEIVQSVKFMAEGLPVDVENLAVAEMLAVGPGGHFLDRDYTLKNIRKLWHAGISHQWSAEMQEFNDPCKTAIEKARWIIENHKPQPLDEKAESELAKVIRAAEKELVDY